MSTDPCNVTYISDHSVVVFNVCLRESIEWGPTRTLRGFLDSAHRDDLGTGPTRVSSLILTRGPLLYYIGVLPAFPSALSPTAEPSSNTLLTRLANDWHTISIRLAARIWSEYRILSRERNSTPRAPQKSVSPPCHHLEAIFPCTYPSLNISFH
jgi:hypothetical protein